jgi:hypothetical protein
LWKQVHDAIQAFGKRSDIDTDSLTGTRALVLDVSNKKRRDTQLSQKFIAMRSSVIGETAMRLGLKISTLDFRVAVKELVQLLNTPSSSSLQLMNAGQYTCCIASCHNYCHDHEL